MRRARSDLETPYALRSTIHTSHPDNIHQYLYRNEHTGRDHVPK